MSNVPAIDDEYFFFYEPPTNDTTINMILNRKAREGFRIVQYDVLFAGTDSSVAKGVCVLMRRTPPNPATDRHVTFPESEGGRDRPATAQAVAR